jgi:thiol-disulfide isomerase/thioredoxin
MMKKPLLLLGCLVLLSASVALRAADSTAAELAGHGPVDRAAPDATFKDVDTGKPVKLSSYHGKVVIVDFWATWCEPCKSEIPAYIELQNKYGKDGLVIVGVSVDTKKPSAVSKFAKGMAINYPILMGVVDDIDGFEAVAGGDIILPTTYVLNRDGRIIYRKKGTMDHAEFEAFVKQVL